MATLSSPYLSTAFDLKQRKEYISRAVRCLSAFRKTTPFDAIVVRGTSGLLFGPSIADKMYLPLMVCRKPKESTHSASLIEGDALTDISRYVIVDDFIASGGTMKQILETFDKQFLNQLECVGVYLWNAHICDGRFLRNYGGKAFYGDKHEGIPLIENSRVLKKIQSNGRAVGWL